MDGIYERAVSAGTKVAKPTFLKEFYRLGQNIYLHAPIPEGVDVLAHELKKLGYRIGIVSASPSDWIMTVVNRLSFKNDIELYISLNERTDLAHKPAPDGYREAMRALQASSPAATIALEDSNSGIASAKAAGAFTIGLRQNLVTGYKQEGADVYADTMRGVIPLVQKHARTLNRIVGNLTKLS